MAEGKRIRVVFKDDDILSETQKSSGLTRSWLLLKPHQHDTVSDVASHLLHSFQLHQSCPHGLLLSISSFVLPPFESSSILKDDEIIRVQKRKNVLSIAGNNAANDVERLKAVEKQPVNNGILLLANEEFEKEKGGYESDDPEEVSEEDKDLVEDVEKPSSSNAGQKNRKRKAAYNIQRSTGKKQRSVATGSASNAVLSDKGKKGDSVAGNSVENNGEPAKLIDESSAPGPSMKGTAEVQENSKETEDAKIAPEVTKKLPSRSARRKYAKRRWLREMAKIQKQNATCESEGLRNWKEDKAKAGRKKKDDQVKGQKKWKKHQTETDSVADGQPKGLLHWTPQDNLLVKGKKRKQRSQNDNFSELPNRSGDAHEQQIQNGDGHQQPNQKEGDSHEQPGQKNAQECENQTCNASEQLNEESGEENEVVPIVIRPGHIRFEPTGKEEAVQKDHVPQGTFQWNGITSKKKGQQWGKESRPYTPRNDYRTSTKEYNETLNNEKEKQADEGNKKQEADDRTDFDKLPTHTTDFDKLPTLLGMPEKGDLIAYRVLELSSSWTPELSPYRVGKVSWYNAKSNQTMLVPVPEYPIISNKADEDEPAQLDSSLYKEDGSLEIDFPSLIDVRILNNGRSEPGNEAASCVSEGSVGDVNASKTVLPSNDEPTVVPGQDAIETNQGQETQPPTTGPGVDVWDQLSETLNAKKEELSKVNGWSSTPKKVQLPPVNSWGAGTPKKVQQHSQENSWGKKPSPGSNWGKKGQGAQDNSWGKQSSGSKSWSYKALRGSALGPTMAMLRSKKDT